MATRNSFGGGGFRAPKPLSFGGGGNPGANQLMAFMMGQQKSQLGKQNNPQEVTTGRTDPITGERAMNPSGSLMEEGIQARGANAQAAAKDVGEKYGQAGRTVLAMKNLMSHAKRAEKFRNPMTGETGSGAIGQITADLTGGRYAPGWLQKQGKDLLPYVAQQEETKMSAVPILSGQARYVVDLANAIAKSVPNVGKTLPIKKDLIGQSVRNMMTLTYGVENGYVNNDTLMKMGLDPNSSPNPDIDPGSDALLQSIRLTPQQEMNINEAIQEVMDVPEMGEGALYSEGPYAANLNKETPPPTGPLPGMQKPVSQNNESDPMGLFS